MSAECIHYAVCAHVFMCAVQGEEEVEETPAEMLYLGMLPNLSQYVVSNGLLIGIIV